MKNIINLLLFLSMFTGINNYWAQTHIPDPHADKFTGTWKWGDTNNGLILILKKENNTQPFKNDPTTLLDSLIGFHKIYKNGEIIENSTSYSNTGFVDQKQTSIGNTDNDNSDILVLFMRHKNKGIRIKLNYINSTQIRIIEVKNQEGVRVILPGQSPTDWSIDIPNNIILTKQ